MGQENSVSISSIEVGYDCVLVYVWGRYVYVSVSAYVWEVTCMYEWRYMSGDQKRESLSPWSWSWRHLKALLTTPTELGSYGRVGSILNY